MSSETPLYLDPARSPDERAADLLGRMTLEEKLAQIGCVWSRELMEGRQFSAERARGPLAHGIGQVTRVGGATSLLPGEVAAFINALQRYLIEQTRLGIPAIVHEESLAGYLARSATCFPQALGLAATWNPALATQVADVIRQQLLAVGARHALAPVLDIARDPRWGRTEETLGEDPYLVSAMGAAYVRGLQTDDLRRGIAATGKHFVGYGFSEGGMNWAPAHIPPRELREVFVRPFEVAIKEAGLATIMNGYHELDGLPCGCSRPLLVDLLRGELGFDGAIVSDYNAIVNLATYHHVAADRAEAARLALQAGMDCELPASDCYGQPLQEALAAGRIDMALVDAAVTNMLRLKFRLGLFENPYADAGAAATVFDTPAQRALARRAAAESIVLLKNEGNLLPLPRTLGAIAVIGPAADSIRLLQGDYHYPGHLEVMSRQEDGAPGAVPALPWAEEPGLAYEDYFVPMVTVLDGIRAAVAEGTRVLYAPGCGVTDPATDGFAEAVAAAQAADVAVVVVGDKSGLTPDCTSGEAVDRLDLGLPGVQQQLVEAVAATGTPTVVVLINGRPLALPWIAAHIPAIVEAWLPGEEGGAAVADVLFGAVNPAGRLPVSLPHHVGQVPVYYNHKPSGGRSHWYGDYRDGSPAPLFPFGHGLSYTTFAYDSLRIEPEQVPAGETFTVRLEVRNTGPRAGDEVVQLYVRDTVASVTRPVKELKGFARVTLQPGERRTITFTLDTALLAFYDAEMRFVVEPGTVEIMVGGSSEDIRLRGTLTITGAVTDVSARRAYLSRVEIH